MVASLRDPYCQFLAPSEHTILKQVEKGEFAGVGIRVTLKDGKPTVIAAVQGSPAEKAGVQPMDILVKIDGENCLGLRLPQIVAKLRGQKASDIVISVKREGHTGLIQMKMTRKKVKIHPPRHKVLHEVIGYLKISLFNEKTGPLLAEALAELDQKSVRGLILDLRQNPGGLLDQARQVCDKFLDSGVIVRTKGRSARHDATLEAQSEGTWRKAPLVVLVDSGSASASEIVAGALQDHRRAALVGETTFGKGVVTQMFPLPDGSALSLTVAEYLTPKGRQIEGKGIAPDVVVKRKIAEGPEPSDSQLERAVQHLKQSVVD